MNDFLFVHNNGFKTPYMKGRVFPYAGTHCWAIPRRDIYRYIADVPKSWHHRIFRLDVATSATIYALSDAEIGRYLWYSGQPIPPLLPFDPEQHVTDY